MLSPVRLPGGRIKGNCPTNRKSLAREQQNKNKKNTNTIKTHNKNKLNKNKYKYKYTHKNKNLICLKLHPPRLEGPHGSFWETNKCTPPVFGYCHDIEKEDEGGQTYLPRKKLRFSFSAFTSPDKCKKYSAIGLYSKMDLSKCLFNYCFFKNNININISP